MIFVSFFSFPESYAPLILRRRAARLRRETGEPRYHTASERVDAGRSASSVLARALSRPLRLLLFHPIIQVSAVLSGFNYGILYVVLSTFSNLWKERYGQSVEISGLHYIACSLGELIGAQVGAPVMDYLYRRREQPRPESRVTLMYFGIVPCWVGALIYGWTAQYGLHWMVVDVGVVIMMFGLQLGDMPCKSLMPLSPKTEANSRISDGVCHRYVWRAHHQRYGGDSVRRELDGVLVPALCAQHVSRVGVWLGEQPDGAGGHDAVRHPACFSMEVRPQA